MTGEWTPERIAELRALISDETVHLMIHDRVLAALDEIERLQASMDETPRQIYERAQRREQLLREAVPELDAALSRGGRALANEIRAEIGDER